MMPFKAGWITIIEATMELIKLGFRFLQTGSLNQDCLENLFSLIRSFGAGNTNPNCYQFIYCFKTVVINNLIDTHSQGRNCEEDDSSFLENVQAFVENNDNESIPVEEIHQREFENISIPP